MKRMLGCLAVVLVLAGCSTTSMKGTPFYTGEYEVREGPSSDRVNLWPLLYYRDPALSVLWPLVEASPEHLALRPIYSLHDRNTDHPVHNVLWPISRFDTANEAYRIFPVFWGDEYFNVFPLYWHEGDPFSGIGHNILFPFWIWQQKDNGYSLDVFWPLYAKRQYPSHQSWRLWPLYGTELNKEQRYRYVAWPFIHAYSTTERAGHMVLPLYFHENHGERSRFISLPYSRSITTESGAKSWDLTLPLCYRRWTGDTSGWVVYPALSWGMNDADESQSWYVLGLGRRLTSEDRSKQHVIPLYYYSRNQESRAFYTLPWWSKTYVDGSGWSTLIPIYHRSQYGDEKAFYTLPWWSKSYMDGSSWQTLFPLYYRSRIGDTSTFYSLPWFSKKHGDGSGWHTSIPLYYRGRGDGYSAFYSLPWLSEKHKDGSEWRAAFPFYYGSSSADGSFMMTPFYARKRHADGSTAWQCIIPLVYLDETKDAHFLTPLGGRWKMGDQYNWLVLPLLSGGSKDTNSGRAIWLAGLAGQQWSEANNSHYVFPFYYSAPQQERFVSLPYSAWRMGERKLHGIPLLLSGWRTESDASGSFLLAGLAGHRSGSGSGDYSYAIPFYYSAPQKDAFISLPYAKWRTGNRKSHAIPPLLSGWYTEGEASGSALLLGLAGHRAGDEDAKHYIFPLYYSAPRKDKFVSLPYAAWNSGDTRYTVSPLLLSGRGATETDSQNMVAGGLAYWSTDKGQVDYSHILPFYLWSRNESFYTALFGKNRHWSYYATPLIGRYGGEAGGSGSWAFPLYWHRKRPSGEIKGNYLLLGHSRKDDQRFAHGVYGLYDYNHWKKSKTFDSGRYWKSEGKVLSYLLFLGQSNERWEYRGDEQGEADELKSYSKNQSFFPLWSSKITEKVDKGERLETSSLLGLLYDTRHEKKSAGEGHDYLRRRVLWRVYHHEKLNGDASTDVFPAITIDSYKNGYYKFSMLWRLFRYEKDPESGRTKLDLLFIPFRR